MDSRRIGGFALLVFANLLWSGNWVIGRAVRESFDPLTLNFLRWLTALVIIAPFAWRQATARLDLIRRHAGLLAVLALTSIVLFQPLVYQGLKTTTAINAVLINAAGPLFIVLCSWLLEREKATLAQIAGMLISFAGVIIIVCRGDVAALAHLEFHSGDGWILLAMAVWGLYPVLLRRLPRELRDAGLVFTMTVLALAMMLPMYLVRLAIVPPRMPTLGDIGAVLYVGVGPSVLAYLCWNRGVATVGANAAGFSMPLLPAFGTLLAMAFLGESFQPFHAAGIATILAGVVLAARK